MDNNPLEYIDVDQNYYSEFTQLINAECKYQMRIVFNDYMHGNITYNNLIQ